MRLARPGQGSLSPRMSTCRAAALQMRCIFFRRFRLPTLGTLKGYSKTLEYEYRVKTATLGTLKRYSILSLTLYLGWYNAYSIVGSGGPH
jgi:hypothetical protein